MDDHATPLNEKTCDLINPGLYRELQALHVGKVLNREAFREGLGRDPCCSSVFLVGKIPGGSYSYHTDQNVLVVVHNGTLVRHGDKSYGAISEEYERLAKAGG